MVNEFNGGKTVGFNSNTLFSIKDEMDENSTPETSQLLTWWQNTGCNKTDFVSLAGETGGSGNSDNSNMGRVQLKSLADIEKENLGTGDQPSYIDVKAYITHFQKRENTYYMADPETNKKVTESGDGSYQTNDGKIVENPSVRLLVNSIKISDQFDECWVTAFNDQAETMLGCTGEELKDAEQNQTSDDIYNRALFKDYFLRLKVKEEFYQDTPRKRVTIMKIAEVDYDQYANYLENLVK